MATTTATKTILIRTTGEETPREFEAEIDQATAVTDILENLGLGGYRLVKPDSTHYELGEHLYDHVVSGQKVMAVRVDDLSAGA